MDKKEFLTEAKSIIENSPWYYMSTYNKDLQSAETRAMANIRSKSLYPEGKLTFEESDLSNYIITALSSGKVKQIKDNNHISLYFFPEYQRNSLTLFGTTEIMIDQELKQKLWKDDWKMYFKLGSEDPEYAVLKFTPHFAKFAKETDKIITFDL